MKCLEAVQYFQFDQQGNMYVFQPGSGFSGPSVKVSPGFEMQECTQETLFQQSNVDEIGDESMFASGCMSDWSQTQDTSASQIQESSQSKRSIMFVLYLYNDIIVFLLMFITFCLINFGFDFRKGRSFSMPLKDSQMVSMTRKQFSDETNKKIAWIKRMYTDWRSFRNSQKDLESFSCDLENVQSINPEGLNVALCRFITEVRKLDGSHFPGKTLYDIIICIQFYLEKEGFSWRLLNDERFKELKFTLDNVMKARTSAGIGITVRKAEVVSFEDEKNLWALGLLGTYNPTVLMHTVVYVIGMTCALRAGKEHRSLRSIPFESQFEYKVSSSGATFIRYTEDIGLKTNKGGIKHRRVDPKIVDIHPISNGDRCPVAIITKYLSMLPKDCKCKSLYLQPKKKYSKDDWYLDRPVGVNTLRKVVKEICEKGGIDGYFTNHSLRSSSATRMYQGGVDEQVIQEVTGHRSLAVRSYKRTCNEQKCRASQIVSGEFS